MSTIENFLELDMRVGTVIKAQPFPEARKSAIKLQIDFGDLGIKNSSAQITHRYNSDNLVGRQVVAIVNLPPKRIARFKSEVLVMGGVLGQEDVVLLTTDTAVPNGTKVS